MAITTRKDACCYHNAAAKLQVTRQWGPQLISTQPPCHRCLSNLMGFLFTYGSPNESQQSQHFTDTSPSKTWHYDRLLSPHLIRDMATIAYVEPSHYVMYP
jgi:hypothetical protein